MKKMMMMLAYRSAHAKQFNPPSCTCSDSHVRSACVWPETLCISVHLYEKYAILVIILLCYIVVFYLFIFFILRTISSVRIIDLVSHTTMLCVLIFLYISGGTYSLKSTPNYRFFFEKFFMAILFDSQSFCQKSAERKSPKKYFSYFVLMSGLGHEPWLFV